MKPHEAGARLREVVALIRASRCLPPELHAWFLGSLAARLQRPGTDLDRLLGLRSRRGGRGGGLHSPIAQRDERIRAVAATVPGTVADKARAIRAQYEAGTLTVPGRMPGVRQIQRVLTDRRG